MSEHLEDERDRVVVVGVRLAVVRLRVDDDDEVRGDRRRPGEAARRHQHLDGARREQLLDERAVRLAQALVQVADAVGERLAQRLCRPTEGATVNKGEGGRGGGGRLRRPSCR